MRIAFCIHRQDHQEIEKKRVKKTRFLVCCFFCSWLRTFAFLSFFRNLRSARSPLATPRTGVGLTYRARAQFLLAVAFHGTQTHQRRWHVLLPTAPSLLSCRRDIRMTSIARSRKRRLFRERERANSSTDSQKEGMDKSKKIKTETQSNKKRSSKAASSHYLTKCNTAVLTLFPGAIPLPGFRVFETRLGPSLTLGPAVLDRVSRCKAHMLVIWKHTRRTTDSHLRERD